MFSQTCERKIFNKISLIDKSTINNVYHVTEFVTEIQKSMLQTEKKWNPDSSYMSRQDKINETIRSTLVDWLIQIHYNFKLLTESLFLTINVIDRYLSKNVIVKKDT